ncbi:major capsid protein [Aurantimonas sp. VKM B-3413]|uniref:major capsid protein n=1 Tax=Aurantimonas sp. VKM B-3413 TaxID=2779401 RepID=UPI001E2AA046|nr:major capsid protein [Aurantimonas sp. VKM B-3413]MCB8835944.1 major capsid protein [Aurantimonas sp. VKM B-3413]
MPELLFPYTNVELTQEVNRVPNTYGLLNALNLAPSEPKASRMVRIDFRDGELVVLAAQVPGGPSQLTPDDTETGVIVTIPHFPHLEAIRVGDLEGNLEVVNGQITERSLVRETTRKILSIRRHHSITREYLRLGMLRGLIKDGKGRTLYDLYDVFDITKKVVDFALGTDTTDVMEKCEEVRDHVMTNIKGETVGMFESVVDPMFFSKLIKHPKVEKFWLQAQNSGVHSLISRQQLAGNWGRVFEFGEILWREYKGGLPVKDGQGGTTIEKNVADNSGQVYPAGTQGMFRTFEGPVHHIDMVNEAPAGGNEFIYISTKVLDHGEGVEMKSQSNTLAINKQPECVVHVTTN